MNNTKITRETLLKDLPKHHNHNFLMCLSEDAINNKYMKEHDTFCEIGLREISETELGQFLTVEMEECLKYASKYLGIDD